MELLEYVKKNNVKKVYVYTLSRLSRRIKEFIEITDHLEEYGCSVVSVTEMIDMSTPQGRLFRNILLSFNEYYSDSLSLTIYHNHKRNVERKKWNGGNPAFGFSWDKHNQKFIENKDYPTLKYMIKLAVQQWGVKKIALHLNRKKMLSPQGKPWRADSVKYILLNEFYRGFLKYDGEIYESDLAPKVINEEEWKAIKANVDRYEGVGPKGKSSTHLLTGITSCIHCSSGFNIRYNGTNKLRRYVCAGRQYFIGQKCPSLFVDADSLECAIIKHIQKLIDDRYFEFILEESKNASEPKQAQIKQDIRRLERNLSNLIQAQEELYEETFVKRMIKKERFYEMNKRFEEEREILEYEIKSMYQEMDTVDPTFIFDYTKALKNFISIFSELTVDEQRIAIHSLIERVHVHDNSVELELPVGKTKIKSTSIKRGTMYFD